MTMMEAAAAVSQTRAPLLGCGRACVVGLAVTKNTIAVQLAPSYFLVLYPINSPFPLTMKA